MWNNILVMGGSGFIGQALQKLVIDRGLSDKFTFTYDNNQRGILPGIKSFRMHLPLTTDLCSNYQQMMKTFDGMIYMVGRVENELECFNGIEKNFDKPMVILTSAKTYTTPLIYRAILREPPTIIIQLSYAFGKGERDTRLYPMIAKAIRGEITPLLITDLHQRLDPLPADTVAAVLLKHLYDVMSMEHNTFNVYTITGPELTVFDIVKAAQHVHEFDYKVVEPIKSSIDYIKELAGVE